MSASTADLAYVEAVVKKSGTSFSLGMRLLPAARRAAMHAVYAFCREIDDIADEPAPLAVKIRGLDHWRAEIDALYACAPQTPIGRALLRPVSEHGLDKSEFLLLIEGMEWDARGPIIAPDWDRLRAYCRRVAGAVGQLSMPIFGAPNTPAADAFAIAMGEGLQLTNIARDVAEDAAEGRLYLPREALAAEAIAPDPVSALGHARLSRVRRAVGLAAEQAFAKADLAARDLPFRALRPALVMRAVYRLSLDAMIADGFQRLEKPKIRSSAKIAAGLAAFFGMSRR